MNGYEMDQKSVRHPSRSWTRSVDSKRLKMSYVPLSTPVCHCLLVETVMADSVRKGESSNKILNLVDITVPSVSEQEENGNSFTDRHTVTN